MPDPSPIIRYATSHLWAMSLGTLRSLCAILERHHAGQRLSHGEIEAVVRQRDDEHPTRRHVAARSWKAWASQDDEESTGACDAPYMAGTALVVPVRGVLAQYAGMVNGVSQPRGMSSQRLTEICNQAASDMTVASVVLHMDSPGGTVAGVSDVVSAVRALASVKPVYAHANDLMASAALWIGSQATSISATPVSLVGSIGVYGVVEDNSEAYAKQGIRRILIASGQHKGAHEDGIPITDAQVAAMAAECAAMSAVFVSDVAAGRKKNIDAIKALADGRCFVGSQAVAMGLVDRIAGLEQVIEEAQNGLARIDATPAKQIPIPQLKGRRMSTALATEPTQADATPDPSMTTDMLKQMYPDLIQTIIDEANQEDPAMPKTDAPPAAESPATFAAIKAAFPNDPAFRCECMDAGLTLSAAHAKYAAMMTDKLAATSKELEDLRAKGHTSKGAAPAVFSAPGATGGPADFAAAVKQIQAAEGFPLNRVGRDRASARAMTKYPGLHRAWLEAGSPAVA